MGVFCFVFFRPMRKLLILVSMLVVSVSAQESIQEIKRQTKTVEKEGIREKELSQTEKKRHQDFVETAKKKLEAYDGQSATLKAQIDSLRAEASRLDAARLQAAGSSHWVDARKVRYQESLAAALDGLVPVLESDIPFKSREAVEAIRETAGQLRKGTVTPEEALGRAFDVIIDRIQLGYTTENWSGYFPWQGRSLSGKYVRYGAVSALFVSQDGSEVFWLQQKASGYEWKSVGENGTLRTLLKEALKVAEGQAPPALVMLPFAALSVKEVKP
jgi:hypothetical protein